MLRAARPGARCTPRWPAAERYRLAVAVVPRELLAGSVELAGRCIGSGGAPGCTPRGGGGGGWGGGGIVAARSASAQLRRRPTSYSAAAFLKPLACQATPRPLA